MIRHRPIQGESNIDFLGKSERSLPQPQDSLPDAGEAINDFWSMSGNIIYRHHVEPRVKLYSPREESFPIPLKYIDVSRTTHTNLDVKQEKRIDDYWNVDSNRNLSDPWTGFRAPAVLLQSGLDIEWWADSMECYWYLRNMQDLLSDGKTPYERRFGVPFYGSVLPYGAMVEYHPISAKDVSRLHQIPRTHTPVLLMKYL